MNQNMPDPDMFNPNKLIKLISDNKLHNIKVLYRMGFDRGELNKLKRRGYLYYFKDKKGEFYGRTEKKIPW